MTNLSNTTAVKYFEKIDARFRDEFAFAAKRLGVTIAPVQTLPEAKISAVCGYSWNAVELKDGRVLVIGEESRRRDLIATVVERAEFDRVVGWHTADFDEYEEMGEALGVGRSAIWREREWLDYARRNAA